MEDVKIDIVEEIRSKINIVDVISEKVPLSKSGSGYVGVCPFHDDSNPSMHVSAEKQIYKCFSCGAGGNVFNFVMDFEHLSFKEVLKILGDRVGIDTHINTKTSRKVDPLLECYEVITKFYENSLFTIKGKDALKYLNERNIPDDVIKEFRIGYSPSGDVITKMLAAKNYTYDTLINIGVTVKSDYGYKDFFFNRIMFPICDPDNKVVAASGRIFNGEETSKYINTKETLYFKKGNILYNYYQAREYALKEKYVIITEGFFDVIRCHIAGFKNVVATMGTAFTNEHVKLIKKLSSNIILLFDGDDAGAKATYSCGNILMKNEIIPKVIRLPEKLDPDEYIIKYGAYSFKKVMDNPITFMEFKLDYLKKNRDITKISDLSSYVNDVIVELESITDSVMRDITIDKISLDLGIDKSIITSRLNTASKQQEINKITEFKEKKLDKYDKASYKLLFYMLRDTDIILMYQNQGVMFPNNIYRNLANEILYFYKNCGTISSASLLTSLNDKKELKDLVLDIESKNYEEKYNREELDDCVDLLRKKIVEKEINRLDDSLRNELDVSKKAEILSKIVELKKREL